MPTRLPIAIALLAAPILAAATPALAQTISNPNALNDTNDRLATQSQIRGVQQQQQFENNQMRMQIQRNEMSRPAPSGPGLAPIRR